MNEIELDSDPQAIYRATVNELANRIELTYDEAESALKEIEQVMACAKQPKVSLCDKIWIDISPNIDGSSAVCTKDLAMELKRSTVPHCAINVNAALIALCWQVDAGTAKRELWRLVLTMLCTIAIRNWHKGNLTYLPIVGVTSWTPETKLTA